MKNILLPTDFSENALNAIKYAAYLFEKGTCNFFLLNVFTPIVYHLDVALINSGQYALLDAMRETSKKKLKQVKEETFLISKNEDLSVNTITNFNALIPEIDKIVIKEKIDLIIMGTKGATGAKKVLLGTNTVHALQNIKCPLLIIPESFEFEKPKEILFPTDYKIAYTIECLKPILDLSRMFSFRINVLHVLNQSLTKEQENNKAVLNNLFCKTEVLFHDVTNSGIQEAIQTFQVKTKINMLIMLNNKHSFFEYLFFKQVINQIGYHTKIPFLVIPTRKI